jgi:hypothetical protein
MMNIEMATANVVAAEAHSGNKRPEIGLIVRSIRETIAKVSDREAVAAHFHGVAFEKPPQPTWQAFFGRRHILGMTWARAEIYELDFGFRSTVGYVDGVMPDMDGIVMIKEAPPRLAEENVPGASPMWIDNGVDISVNLRVEDIGGFVEGSDALIEMHVMKDKSSCHSKTTAGCA